MAAGDRGNRTSLGLRRMAGSLQLLLSGRDGLARHPAFSLTMGEGPARRGVCGGEDGVFEPMEGGARAHPRGNSDSTRV